MSTTYQITAEIGVHGQQDDSDCEQVIVTSDAPISDTQGLNILKVLYPNRWITELSVLEIS